MDDMEDFEFGGELPDDDDDLNGKEEYDVNNEVTFGDDIGNFENPDLANYADQTTALSLERPFGDLWTTPGRSTDAPDASNLPLPTFGFEDSFTTSKENPWDTGTNGLFNIWSSPAVGLGGPLGSKPVGKDVDDSDVFMDYMEKAQAARQQQMSEMIFGREQKTSAISNVSPLRPADVQASKLRPPLPSSIPEAPRPPEALTAADLELKLIEESRIQKEKQAKTIPPMLAAMFQSQARAQSTQGVQQAPPPHSYGNQQHQQPYGGPQHQMNGPPPPMGPPPPPHGRPDAPPGMGPRPLPPWVTAIPPPFHRFIPVWMELLSGRLRVLPPGIPPVPPVLIEMVKTMGPPPPGPMFPPMPPGLPNGPMFGARPGFGSPMMNLSRGPTPFSEQWRSRPSTSMGLRKPPGFPTGKTIEDFAFDPYAGFMSKKEREWLIKIQLLQSMGNNQPFIDDYYYTMWHQKQMEGQNGNGLGSGDDNKRDKKQKDLVHRNYTAPKFNGSLGKPVASTTTNPRHLIDVSAHSDNGDDEGKKPLANQKKYRTLLLGIENASVMLLQCEDRRRHPTPTSEAEITEKMEKVMQGLLNTNMVPKMLQIAKGRRLLAEIFRTSPQPYQARVVQRLFEGAHRAGAPTRVPREQLVSLQEELVPVLVDMFDSWTRDQLVEASKHIDTTTLKKDLEDKNTVARDLLVCYLYACARNKAHSSSDLFAFLRCPSTIDWTSFDPTSPSWRPASRLSKDQICDLADWLRLLSHGGAHEAARLANSLQSA